MKKERKKERTEGEISNVFIAIFKERKKKERKNHVYLGISKVKRKEGGQAFMLLFILRPTSVRMWHKAFFKVGPVAGPKPNATGSSKNVLDPVGIPLFGAPQASGNNPPPEEG